MIFEEVREKDLEDLARIYTVDSFDTKPNDNWTFSSSMQYLNYFYKLQPDLFICAYDKDIPVAGAFGTLKPSFNGMHLSNFDFFVHEDYKENLNMKKQLFEYLFNVAISKYHISYIDTISNEDCLFEYNKIGLEKNNNLYVLENKIENCLYNLDQ